MARSTLADAAFRDRLHEGVTEYARLSPGIGLSPLWWYIGEYVQWSILVTLLAPPLPLQQPPSQRLPFGGGPLPSPPP